MFELDKVSWDNIEKASAAKKVTSSTTWIKWYVTSDNAC
jgi:hypothetical protein